MFHGLVPWDAGSSQFAVTIDSGMSCTKGLRTIRSGSTAGQNGGTLLIKISSDHGHCPAAMSLQGPLYPAFPLHTSFQAQCVAHLLFLFSISGILNFTFFFFIYGHYRGVSLVRFTMQMSCRAWVLSSHK